MSEQSGLLAAFAPPILLIGAVFLLARPRGELGEGMVVRTKQLPAQTRRHQARKFYGSAVLARQSAISMRKLFYDTGSRPAREHARAMAMLSRRLLDDAARMDRSFVREKLSV